MKKNILLSCLLAALIPGLAQAVPQAGQGPRNIDANGDGIITKAEAESGGARRLVENFAEMDTDGNGELTRDERRAYRMERKQAGRSRAQAADTDDNGALSLNEAKAADMPRLVERFARIDKNGDGEVTRNEMQAMGQDKRAKMKGQGPEKDGIQKPGQGRGQGKGKDCCQKPGQGRGQGKGKGPQN